MSDKLKNHIDGNRDDFEIYPFNVEEEWSKVSSKLRKEKTPNAYKIVLSIAASIILVLVGTISFSNFYDSFETGYSTEVHETQNYYQDIIDAKMVLVKSQINDPKMLADLEELDQAFAELKSDLQDDAQNEEVVMAMIDNYRLKLKILERILENLEDDSHEEDFNL